MSATEKTTASPALQWRHSMLWLLFLGPFFFLSYGTANQIAASSGTTRSLFFEWERHTPFLPWTIIPYWSIDLLYGLSFLCCRSKYAVDRHAFRLATAQLISVACFLLFPLRFAFTRPETDGIAGALFTALTQFDQPYNQAPSLHISLLVLIWFQFARLSVPATIKFLIHAWAALIAISVLTTWQHHFIDVPTGAAVGLFCLWLWPEEKPSPLSHGLTADPHRLRLASIYLFGAISLLVLAIFIGGTALWLCWPALSLAIVALIYAVSGAPGFQKTNGQHELAPRILLAPYLVGAWFNSRIWTRKHPAPAPIIDGVWLGRLPTSSEWRQLRLAALFDVSAELRLPSAIQRGISRPWLDLVPPCAHELLAAAREIERLRAHGPVLVACALGYSRSAAAVAAWLCWSGRSKCIASAVELIRQQRPNIVLNAAALHSLTECQSLCETERNA